MPGDVCRKICLSYWLTIYFINNVDRLYSPIKELGDTILNCDINVVCVAGPSCFRMMSDIKIIPSQKELNLKLDV